MKHLICMGGIFGMVWIAGFGQSRTELQDEATKELAAFHFDGAIECLQELQVREVRKKGSCSIANTKCLAQLGNCYRQSGQFQLAAKCYREAVRIDSSLGSHHRELLASHFSLLGETYLQLGAFHDAYRCSLTAIDLDSSDRNLDSAEFALHLNHLALASEEMGMLEQAESIYLSAADVIKRLMDGHHIVSAIIGNNLGDLYRELGEYDKADSCLKASLVIFRDLFGDNHPSYAKCLLNLGRLESAQSLSSLSEQHLLKSIEIQRLSLGNFHPDCIASQCALAELYLQINNGTLSRGIIDVLMTSFPIGNADFLLSWELVQGVFSHCLMLEGEYDSMQLVLHVILDRKTNDSVELNENHLINLNRYGCALWNLLKIEAADSIFRRLNRLSEKLYKKANMLRLYGLGNLAGLHSDEGHYLLADSLFRSIFGVIQTE